VQLDELASDSQPLRVVAGQLGEQDEQLPSVPSVPDCVLNPDRAGELLRGIIVVEFLTDQTSDRQDLVGVDCERVSRS